MSCHWENLDKASYGVEDIDRALAQAGVKTGDVCIVHFSLFSIGLLRCEPDENPVQIWLDALVRAVGTEGCIILPAFSYSYGKNKVYDPLKTKSSINCLANYCIKTHQGYRTPDPFFSYIILPGSESIAAQVTAYEFSNVCFDIEGGIIGLARSLNPEPKYLDVCSLQDCDHETFLHSADQLMRRPNRFMKAFDGTTIINGQSHENRYYFYCRVNVSNTINTLSLSEITKNHTIPLGCGVIYCIDLNTRFNEWMRVIDADCWKGMKGPALSPEELRLLISKESDAVDPDTIVRSYTYVFKL